MPLTLVPEPLVAGQPRGRRLGRAVARRFREIRPACSSTFEADGPLTMTQLAEGVVYSRSGLTYQAALLEKAGPRHMRNCPPRSERHPQPARQPGRGYGASCRARRTGTIGCCAMPLTWTLHVP
jgi:hypothetical protein